MKPKVKPEDQDLFRNAMKGVKQLVTKNLIIKTPTLPIIHRKKLMPEPAEADQFSDHEFLAPVTQEDSLSYSAPGNSTTVMRALRRGQFNIAATLDLHGMTVAEARRALHLFLLECNTQEIRFGLIIHGKGRFNAKPILKNKLNHWLRDTRQVLAFCSAREVDGGRGAVYVRLRGI